MLPKPTAKYVGLGPFRLARMTHEVEGEDDIEFLAIQDAVSTLTPEEQKMYRLQYVHLCKTGGK